MSEHKGILSNILHRVGLLTDDERAVADKLDRLQALLREVNASGPEGVESGDVEQMLQEALVLTRAIRSDMNRLDSDQRADRRPLDAKTEVPGAHAAYK